MTLFRRPNLESNFTPPPPPLRPKHQLIITMIKDVDKYLNNGLNKSLIVEFLESIKVLIDNEIKELKK